MVERQPGPAFKLNHGPSDNDSPAIDSSQLPFPLRWALCYGSMGLKVLPLRHGDNRPHWMLGSGWTRETVGSSDPDQIIEWWQADMGANIGVVNGPRSGVLILDLDNKEGKPQGVDSIFALMDEYGEELPDTSWVKTPSGGVHLWFAWPEGEPPVPVSIGWLPGVDVPWQVAVPPSAKLVRWASQESWMSKPETVEDNVPYRWTYRVDPLPLPPRWLLADIRTRPRTTNGGLGPRGRASHSSLPPTEEFLGRGLGWFTGSRNVDAHRLACRLWFKHHGDPEAVIADMYRAWEATPQFTHAFPWPEALGAIASAHRRWREVRAAEEQLVRRWPNGEF